jgi:hypothetical protein
MEQNTNDNDINKSLDDIINECLDEVSNDDDYVKVVERMEDWKYILMISFNVLIPMGIYVFFSYF